jgi:hypothetical protein
MKDSVRNSREKGSRRTRKNKIAEAETKDSVRNSREEGSRRTRKNKSTCSCTRNEGFS